MIPSYKLMYEVNKNVFHIYKVYGAMMSVRVVHILKFIPT